jgi:nicotinamide mononucleotide adenylyltransferase
MRFKDFILKEEKEKHAVLAFGRMNPPTTGHQVLVNKVHDIANKNNASHHVVLSGTQDKAKNPLSSAQKLKHAQRFFPKTNVTVATKEHPNFLKQAEKLHKKGVTHLHMVAGSDRTDEYHKLLHKYNGTHTVALFNFKHIQVHSAGERDPDAEGTTGMSASKMRSHASSGKYDEFKKGIPSHVRDHHAKELYHDVRKGMNVKEHVESNDKMDILFEQILEEGVHDKAIFKAVFLSGGPGSGKDYVLSNTLDGHGLIEINSDKALEYLMDKNKLDKKMPESEKQEREFVRGRSKNITDIKEKLAIAGRNGLIINGTGDDPKKVAKIKKYLEDMGYETNMVLVNTRDEVSQERNVERGQRGGRTVPEEIRKDKWNNVQNARPELAKMFGDNYVEFDNSEDLRKAPPEVKAQKDAEMMDIFKRISKFIAKTPESEQSKSWIASELSKKDTLPVSKNGTEKTAPKDSGAYEKAMKLGLQYSDLVDMEKMAKYHTIQSMINS